MSDKQKTAFESMNKYYYYGGTLLIYILEVIGAAFIRDLGVIFSFGAAISGSAVQFILPGYFYLHAEYKFGTITDRR